MPLVVKIFAIKVIAFNDALSLIDGAFHADCQTSFNFGGRSPGNGSKEAIREAKREIFKFQAELLDEKEITDSSVCVDDQDEEGSSSEGEEEEEAAKKPGRFAWIVSTFFKVV